MAPDRPDAVAPSNDRRSDFTTETSTTSAATNGGGPLPPISTLVAAESRGPNNDSLKRDIHSGNSHHNNNSSHSGNITNSQNGAHTYAKPTLYTDGAFSQSDPRSADGSQASNATTVPDQVFTPTHTGGGPLPPPQSSQPSVSDSGPGSQLLQLSELAAGQQRMRADSAASARKRTADGLVKSPVRGGGHSRTTSAVSNVSTTSTIGEIASNLRNNLSWAAYKHKNGWEDKSFHEIESMVQSSHSTSPVSATSVLPPYGGSPHFGTLPESNERQRKLGSPPSIHTNKPTLAPPASIRPSAGTAAHPRRNSSPRHTPSLLGQSHSLSHAGSPRTPAQPHALQSASGRLGLQITDSPLFPPHQDTREKDTVEALMFLSSPNNSASLKHSFSPAGSPGPQSQPTPRSNGRHALPSGPRKALPNHRPAAPSRRVEFEASPQTAHAHSPMMLDSPTYSNSPNRVSPRKRLNGEPGHFRSALSLDALMGRRSVPMRKPLTDKDVLKMLDRGTDQMDMSSDDEDIVIPRRGETALS